MLHLQIFDGVIVLVSLILDIAISFSVIKYAIMEGVVLIILLRLWRFVRLVCCEYLGRGCGRGGGGGNWSWVSYYPPSRKPSWTVWSLSSSYGSGASPGSSAVSIGEWVCGRGDGRVTGPVYHIIHHQVRRHGGCGPYHPPCGTSGAKWGWGKGTRSSLVVGCIEDLRRFSGISAISRLGSRR